MAAAAILKNRKIAISRLQFQRFKRNLAQWRSSTIVTVCRYKFEILKIEDCGADILENPKITISQQRFDRSAQPLAWWRILSLRTRSAV